MLSPWGSFEDEKLVGIIATRSEGSHIALFFVERSYQNRGIGRSLWNAVIETSCAKEIMVHSSIYAKGIYENFGFLQNGELCADDGIQYIPMIYNVLIQRLQDKDDKKAYAFARKIDAASAASDEYYPYFEDFLGLTGRRNSFVRTRGFILCCAQARWDSQGKLQEALPVLMRLLHDAKPTVVRQCLAALHEVALYRPELCEPILAEVKSIDLSEYKDSIAPLIKKDIDELMKVLE